MERLPVSPMWHLGNTDEYIYLPLVPGSANGFNIVSRNLRVGRNLLTGKPQPHDINVPRPPQWRRLVTSFNNQCQGLISPLLNTHHSVASDLAQPSCKVLSPFILTRCFHSKPAESFLSSPPMTKISATTYIMSYFTSLHFNSDSNHSPAPHPLSHFTGCTALSLASSPVHFLHIGQTNLRWSTNLDYFP